MRLLRFVFVACFLLGLSSCSGSSEKKESDKDAAKNDKLVGTWEMVELVEELPEAKGTTEFTKEGKPKVTVKIRNQTQVVEGTYEVDKDKVRFTLKPQDGKEHSQTFKIKTLDDANLILVDEKGEVHEYKRK